MEERGVITHVEKEKGSKYSISSDKIRLNRALTKFRHVVARRGGPRADVSISGGRKLRIG